MGTFFFATNYDYDYDEMTIRYIFWGTKREKEVNEDADGNGEV